MEERFVFSVAVDRSRWRPLCGDIPKEELAAGIWIIVFYHPTALSSVVCRKDRLIIFLKFSYLCAYEAFLQTANRNKFWFKNARRRQKQFHIWHHGKKHDIKANMNFSCEFSFWIPFFVLFRSTWTPYSCSNCAGGGVKCTVSLFLGYA